MYLSTCGAMALHGPHHVAQQSRTTILWSFRAAVYSALLFGYFPQLISIRKYKKCEVDDRVMSKLTRGRGLGMEGKTRGNSSIPREVMDAHFILTELLKYVEDNEGVRI